MTWKYLFYDKYANNNSSFVNNITQNIQISDLDNAFNILYSDEAIAFYNKYISKGNSDIPLNIEKDNDIHVTLYRNKQNINNGVYTIVGIKVNHLEKINKKFNEKYIFVKNLCRNHLYYTQYEAIINNNKNNSKYLHNIEYIQNKIMIPTDYTFNDKIDDVNEINKEYKLFQYQKCSIKWMLDIENKCPTIQYSTNMLLDFGDTYYCLENNLIYNSNNKKTIQFRGGALIDEVGLGKTVQMLALSIKNPLIDTSYFKNGSNKLHSRATLILCPNHLCGQWKREIDKMINKSYNASVITFATKVHHDKYTYMDVLDADFVILSYNFLGNKSFSSKWLNLFTNNDVERYYTTSHWSSNTFEIANQVFNKHCDTLTNNLNILFETNVVFQYIHWHRLIIDEFHELVYDYKSNKYTHVNNMVPLINSNYRWAVTATPINKKNSMHELVNFVTHNNNDTDIYENDEIVNYIINNFFRRNTKDSISKEYTLPPLEEQIVWLKFTQTERAMYNAYLVNHCNDRYGEYLRQLCCNPQLAEETKGMLNNCKSLKEIENTMLQYYKSQVSAKIDIIKKLITKINNCKPKVNKYKYKYGLLNDVTGSKIIEEIERIFNIIDNIDPTQDIPNKLVLSDPPIININKQDENGPLGKLSLTYFNVKKRYIKYKTEIYKLEGLQATLRFFVNVIEKIEKTSKSGHKKSDNDVIDIKNYMDNIDEQEDEDNDAETCGICMSIIPEDDIGVTKCGHIYCYECLKSVIIKYKRCPMCNNPLEIENIYMLSYEKKTNDKNISDIDKQKLELINEVGTKIANLIYYLKEHDRQTIIFSQWDNLLEKIGKILDKYDLKNIFCKGNCYQKDKAIRDFNDDPKTKIIMLSSNTTISGANLTKANTVIFIDPIYGSPAYRKNQEMQAIGRAHRMGQQHQIKVVRLVIKDTIEEEIYVKNLEVDNNKK